jgi:hypothetical protein
VSWGQDVLDYRRLIAIHEAGHAVASHLVDGGARIALTIARDRDGLYEFSGLTTERYRKPSQRQLLEHWRSRAFVSAAGAVAESKYCREMGWPDRSEDCSTVDRANIDRAAEMVVPGNAVGYRGVVLERARREFERPAVWPATLALADELDGLWPDDTAEKGEPGEYVGTMDGEQVAAICQRAL